MKQKEVEQKDENIGKQQVRKKKAPVPLHKAADFTIKPAAIMYFKNSSLCVQELKILEEYFFQMSCKDPGQEYVTIPHKRIEQILGVSKVRPEALDRYLKNIGQPVSVRGSNGQFLGIGLMDSYGWLDAERRSKVLSIKPTAALQDLYDRIGEEGRQFFKYRTMLSDYLTTSYSIWLASYIITNMFKKTWSVSEKELKQMMNCTSKYYSEGRYFRYEVLNPSVKEINSSNLIFVEYTYEIKDQETIYYFKITMKGLLQKPKEESGENKVISTQEELKQIMSPEQYTEAMKYIKMLYSSDEEHHLLTKYQRAQLHAKNKDSGSIYNYMLQSLKNETGNG